jgi:hypothetical protein
VEAMFLLTFGKYRRVIGFSGCDHVKDNAGQFVGRRGDGFGRSRLAAEATIEIA